MTDCHSFNYEDLRCVIVHPYHCTQKLKRQKRTKRLKYKIKIGLRQTDRPTDYFINPFFEVPPGKLAILI